MGDAPIGDLDSLFETIALNFVLLPIVSIVIYGLSILVFRRTLNSLWYISLGLPATIVLLLGIADEIVIPHSNEPAGVRIAQSLAVILAYFPGFTVPFGVLLFHLVTFSRTNLASRGSYLWGLAIAATYCWNWIMFAVAIRG
jgi:hypothetical protein